MTDATHPQNVWGEYKRPGWVEPFEERYEAHVDAIEGVLHAAIKSGKLDTDGGIREVAEDCLAAAEVGL